MGFFTTLTFPDVRDCVKLLLANLADSSKLVRGVYIEKRAESMKIVKIRLLIMAVSWYNINYFIISSNSLLTLDLYM